LVKDLFLVVHQPLTPHALFFLLYLASNQEAHVEMSALSKEGLEGAQKSVKVLELRG
jgi:hypothetical protein